MRLPVIVGMGGVNATGRTSGFQGFRRMVLDALPTQEREETLVGLAVMMGLVSAESGHHYRDTAAGGTAELLTAAEVANQYGKRVQEGTLVRRIDPSYFDADALPWQSSASLKPNPDKHTGELQFVMPVSQLPTEVPTTWTVVPRAEDPKQALVTIAGELDVKLNNLRDFPVKAAGQLPAGFSMSELYKSRFQPRGLQMAIFGATDALRSTGVEWDHVLESISPDHVGVYSGSGFGQMDDNGYGGMLKARMQGGRMTAKFLAMGINSMPTDFVSAYVLGNLGISSTSVGACASFLYNLRMAVADIQAGKVRFAMVGNSEAPIVPELMDGFATMRALATEDNMRRVYGAEDVDYRRASRPFGTNCGFTMGEASQYFVLMDDDLAMTLGTPILGAVTDVFVDADGVKKSITAPGPGNHITMAKAAAAAAAIVGDEALRERSFVLAHGSSTPQNRVTESQIFDQVAGAFDIWQWPVVAVKSYVGHTIAPASGDQLAVALGAFAHGILPGINTIDAVADDVHQARLRMGPEHIKVAPEQLEVALLNSKGFGGNNASAVVLSPARTEAMLATRHGAEAMAVYRDKRESVSAVAQAYFERADRGDYVPIYRFGEGMIADEDISINRQAVTIKGCTNSIALPQNNPYADMVD